MYIVCHIYVSFLRNSFVSPVQNLVNNFFLIHLTFLSESSIYVESMLHLIGIETYIAKSKVRNIEHIEPFTKFYILHRKRERVSTR